MLTAHISLGKYMFNFKEGSACGGADAAETEVNDFREEPTPSSYEFTCAVERLGSCASEVLGKLDWGSLKNSLSLSHYFTICV